MSVEKKFYGYTADQKEISSYTLTNKSGMKAVLLDIGAVIESLLVPDKNGNLVDVVLGFGDPKLYLENNGSLGAVVGRHANRIANATYTLTFNGQGVVWCAVLVEGAGNLIEVATDFSVFGGQPANGGQQFIIDRGNGNDIFSYDHTRGGRLCLLRVFLYSINYLCHHHYPNFIAERESNL